MSVDTTNAPYNPYYDLETGVQHGSDRVNDPSAQHHQQNVQAPSYTRGAAGRHWELLEARHSPVRIATSSC